MPPWLVDRIFRHLLVDLTGNTHRAEFCIDKLYSPDTATGRLGLVEFRAFEMPPHARMSLTQQLLLRTLVSWFWREPCRSRPIRWGTQLHDRFMLPHFVWQDFSEVIDDLNRAGYPIEADWFLPHREFRFPVYGRDSAMRASRSNCDRRSSPGTCWAKNPAAAARSATSIRRSSGCKFALSECPTSDTLCCATAVACRCAPTATLGEFVAGVRYRAWQPPSCLHPTIPVDTPLVFDLYDTWNDRSIGGCTYHVAHPGGLSYETFPVNAMEAETRRVSRFFPHGHTAGSFSLPPVETNPEFPCTLDLRRGR